MTNQPVRSVALLAVLVLSGIAVLPGTSALNNGAALDPCDLVLNAVKADFDTYPDRMLPQSVAAEGVHRIYDACSDPTPDDANSNLLAFNGGGGSPGGDGGGVGDVVGDLAKDSCSGGGLTVTGWADEIYVLNNRFSVLRGPASSYWTVAKNYANGYTRSLPDDIEIVGNVGNWQFFGLPMKGYMFFEAHCAGPLVTSVVLSVEGNPLGLGGNLLMVGARGTTCLVPC